MKAYKLLFLPSFSATTLVLNDIQVMRACKDNFWDPTDFDAGIPDGMEGPGPGAGGS